MLELVLETKHMPQSLAQHGTVTVTAEEVAQRIGQVFIQRVRSLRLALQCVQPAPCFTRSLRLALCVACGLRCARVLSADSPSTGA